MRYNGLKFPPEYAKPRFVVADNLVDAAREFWGDAADVIAISDTKLPDDSQSDAFVESAVKVHGALSESQEKHLDAKGNV